MFRIGDKYSTYEVCKLLGGSYMQNLPIKGGIVRVIFIPDPRLRKDELTYIQILDSPNSIKAALSLLNQDSVHTFIKRSDSSAEYIGRYYGASWITEKNEVEYYKYAEITKIHSIVLLVKDEDQDNKPFIERKVCKCCNKERSIEDFFKSQKNKDGYTKWCRVCLENNR